MVAIVSRTRHNFNDFVAHLLTYIMNAHCEFTEFSVWFSFEQHWFGSSFFSFIFFMTHLINDYDYNYNYHNYSFSSFFFTSPDIILLSIWANLITISSHVVLLNVLKHIKNSMNGLRKSNNMFASITKKQNENKECHTLWVVRK